MAQQHHRAFHGPRSPHRTAGQRDPGGAATAPGVPQLVATTFTGLEPVLARELHQLGARNVQTRTRAVSFSGDTELVYRANLWLRTAIRVLAPVHSFTAENENALYDGVRDVDWSNYLDVDGTLAVDSAVNSLHFTHSKYVSLKVKDAVVDQFRDRYGRRPSVDLDNPHLQIHIYISNDRCVLSLDSSGQSLHRRGYRQSAVLAPLSEILAAGMILLTEWNGHGVFVDPMCGSGTLPIEAALIAHNMPPGATREGFAFMQWRSFDRALWQKVCAEAAGKRRENPSVAIHGSDISEKAVAVAKENADRAGVGKLVTLGRQAFEEWFPPKGRGTAIMNPPYGERLKEEDIRGFYKMIGNQLKHKYEGYDAWILSSNRDALKYVGLKPSKKIILFNGALECKFQKFAMYFGSRDKPAQTGSEPSSPSL